MSAEIIDFEQARRRRHASTFSPEERWAFEYFLRLLGEEDKPTAPNVPK